MRHLHTVLLALLAGVAFGLTLVFLARGSEDSPLLTLVGMRMTSVSVLVVLAVVADLGAGRDLDPLVDDRAAQTRARSDAHAVHQDRVLDLGAGLDPYPG